MMNATVDLNAYAGQTVNLKLGANNFGDQTGNIRFDFVEFAESAGCDAPSDVPWLSVAPDAGTTFPGSSTDVDVTTDSTALVPGLYEASLCVSSNDPVTPLVEVPVDMAVNNESPEADVDPLIQWPQYSDEISPITIMAIDNIAEVLTAATSWSSDGTTFSLGLPDFLALSGPSCIASGSGMQTCTWTISGVIDLPEGEYTVRTTVSDDYGGVTVTDTAIEVFLEDATVAFDDDNLMTIKVATDRGDTGPFSLTVHVSETQPDLPTNPADGVAPGDISRANVTMTLVPVGPGSSLPGACLPGTVSGSGYDAVLTVTCDFNTVPVNTYLVQADVDGDYYIGSGESVLVVYDPSLGFATGGGWFYWPDTDDPENDYAGDKTNFGYNMKYNEKGQRVRGNLLLIRYLADGSIYRWNVIAASLQSCFSNRDPIQRRPDLH